jgi:translation initiation factor IF-2
MGHVDHGKTSLLDHLRQTNVIAGEAGGITQHIGAYRLELDGGRSVTFLDTPGHEAFTAMRARGAEITDVVVLVVAADDAVMPQTIEAISHAKNAGVPIIVAINKVDLPAADVPKVQQDLLSHDVVLEEFGGDVLSAAVSAKTGQGVDELLEKVLLQAELLELKANPNRPAGGTVVEAQLDRGMGPVATVLVQSGTLRVGDNFICGLFDGRVRALLDERDKNVEEAGPSMPVRVLGLEGVPQAGDSLMVAEAERTKEISGRRQQLEREKDMRRRQKGTRLTDLFDTVQAGEGAVLNLVIKADTDGSVQALSDSLERLSTGEVMVEVIHRGVGAINESDVLLASTSSAAIIGFHVRPDAGARDLAQREGIEIRSYDVIYEAVEDMRLALEGLLKPEEREVIVGTAEVRKLFRVPKVGTVAGCYVAEGVIQRNLPVHLLRDQLRIYSGKVDSLKRFKDDVREVREGYECGISIEGYNDIKEGDLIESYRIDEIARTLAESAAATETATS